VKKLEFFNAKKRFEDKIKYSKYFLHLSTQRNPFVSFCAASRQLISA
jgi:hypothetical protein